MSAVAEARLTGRTSPFESLRIPAFRWLYASNAAFFFAMNGQFVVRSYLAFKLTDDNAFALGLINLTFAIPMLFISPFGGVVADRVDRKKVVMAGQFLLVINELLVFALLFTDRLEFWHLLVFATVMACIFPFNMPARQAMTVDIVGKRQMTNAMALSMGAMNAARVVAPALAGFLIAIVGVKSTYLVAVVMYGVALLAMTRLPSSRGTNQRASGSTVYSEILEGMRYVKNDRTLRILIALSIVPMLLAMPFQALLVVFAEEVWDVGSKGLGILQAAAGLGGVLGAFYVAAYGNTSKRLRLMMGSLICFAATLFAFALSPWFLLALPLVLVSDVFANIFGTSNNTIIQLLVPDEVRGRVTSLLMMSFGFTPLGTVPVAAAAEIFGAPAAVAAASIMTMLLTVAFFALSGSLRNVDEITRAAIEAERELPPVGRPGRPGQPGRPAHGHLAFAEDPVAID